MEWDVCMYGAFNLEDVEPEVTYLSLSATSQAVRLTVVSVVMFFPVS